MSSTIILSLDPYSMNSCDLPEIEIEFFQSPIVLKVQFMEIECDSHFFILWISNLCFTFWRCGFKKTCSCKCILGLLRLLITEKLCKNNLVVLHMAGEKLEISWKININSVFIVTQIQKDIMEDQPWWVDLGKLANVHNYDREFVTVELIVVSMVLLPEV